MNTLNQIVLADMQKLVVLMASNGEKFEELLLSVACVLGHFANTCEDDDAKRTARLLADYAAGKAVRSETFNR